MPFFKKTYHISSLLALAIKKKNVNINSDPMYSQSHFSTWENIVPRRDGGIAVGKGGAGNTWMSYSGSQFSLLLFVLVLALNPSSHLSISSFQ